MIGWLAWRAARKTARLVEQDQSSRRSCVEPKPFDSERYDKVTEDQLDQNTFISTTSMAATTTVGELLAIVLAIVTPLSWWWMLAPIAAYAMFGLTCKVYTREDVANDGLE